VGAGSLWPVRLWEQAASAAQAVGIGSERRRRRTRRWRSAVKNTRSKRCCTTARKEPVCERVGEGVCEEVVGVQAIHRLF